MAYISASAPPAAPSFRDRMPRVYELKDALPDPSHADAYFRGFEENLRGDKIPLAPFVRLEGWLAALAADAWSDLKERAASLLLKPMPGRGWEPLWNVFSEARAYKHLVDIGCSDVRFIKRAKGRTPDIAAMRDRQPVFCEVKTINISTEEAEKRERVSKGEIVGGTTSIHLSQGFLDKLADGLRNAVEQLDAVDPQRQALRFAFVVVRFDDFVGQFQPEYFADIDAHLLLNPVVGAELIFCSASNLFERAFVMRSATVLSE